MMLTVQRLVFGLALGTEVVLTLTDPDGGRAPWLELRVFVDASLDTLAEIQQQAIAEGYRLLARVVEDRPA